MQFTSSESIVIRWKTKVAISIQLPYIPEKAEYSANSSLLCIWWDELALWDQWYKDQGKSWLQNLLSGWNLPLETFWKADEEQLVDISAHGVYIKPGKDIH